MQFKHKFAYLALSCALLFFGVLLQINVRAQPPKQAKIAFSSNRDGNHEIYVMDADGSNQRRLTNNPAWDQHPFWSPDGKSIAFTSDRDGNFEIYVMDADGSNQRKLTNNSASDTVPSWSPDGKSIAFNSYRDGNYEIYVMDADGSNQRKLTNNPAGDVSPSWSPDGKSIAFTSERDGNSEIYVMDADGSNQRNFTNHPASDSYPNWFPWVSIRVETISPQEGRVTGGEFITIFGSGFPTNASVTIGGKPLTELKVTDTLITGITPPGTEGEQDVWITAPSIVFAGKFIYFSPSNVVVTGITPTNGKQAGGDAGRISGSGFLSGATVTIDGVKATDVIVQTTTLITFTIPLGTEGAKDVVVMNPGGQKGTLRNGYTYNPLPLIEEIKPDEGPLAGRTQITITGNNFMQGVVVTIGEERIWYDYLDFFSPTELRLMTPPGTAGLKEVRVLNPDGQEAMLKEGFTYNPAPTILSVSPNMGPLEGGTSITIIGTGFLGSDVFVGGAEALSERVVSPTKIKAETPPSSSGAKDVVVINRDGQVATLEHAFTYNLAPVITGVTPNNGRLAGGTKITIQGNGFLTGARVLISIDEGIFMSASSVQVLSPAVITAETPSGDPGTKDVMVRNPDRQDVTLRNGFTYNPMPEITSISPNYGFASGGTKVIIKGTGFLQGAKVIIGERNATTEVKDGATIEAVTPSNPPGKLDVRIINPDTQEVVKRKGFISVGEVAYNYPNPFRASQGTTFRYVTNERVESITVRIFNVRGVPIGVVGRNGSNEVRWQDSKVHAGLYVYLMEVRLEDGKMRRFKRALEVYK